MSEEEIKIHLEYIRDGIDKIQAENLRQWTAITDNKDAVGKVDTALGRQKGYMVVVGVVSGLLGRFFGVKGG